MKRSTFLASIAALILAPFGVKAFNKPVRKQLVYDLELGTNKRTYYLKDALENSKPATVVFDNPYIESEWVDQLSNVDYAFFVDSKGVYHQYQNGFHRISNDGGNWRNA